MNILQPCGSESESQRSFFLHRLGGSYSSKDGSADRSDLGCTHDCFRGDRGGILCTKYFVMTKNRAWVDFVTSDIGASTGADLQEPFSARSFNSFLSGKPVVGWVFYDALGVWRGYGLRIRFVCDFLFDSTEGLKNRDLDGAARPDHDQGQVRCPGFLVNLGKATILVKYFGNPLELGRLSWLGRVVRRNFGHEVT
ncbi:hypothetical protein BDV24DRAFT_40701 [Aspergillus arachidicola]|uniref:Uncharacterized protein n=1 Tax=Aspergillus arachidicola TaxID=656916 RepID=A0A5N6YAZ4_9EURO|nr:hypothetical protein BDV24DRAFT_40701 [Aspergillus arachidicola]